MLRKYLLPVLAVAGFIWMVFAVRAGSEGPVSSPAVVAPSANPYGEAISGAGIVEAASENIAVSPAIGGIVSEVFVGWGDRVKAGEALFKVDPRPVEAQIAVAEAEAAGRRAQVLEAKAAVARLKAMPRKEDVPVLEAKAAQARASLARAKDQWERLEKLAATAAVSADEVTQRRFAFVEAEAASAAAEAELARLREGAWGQEVAVAEAAVASAEAQWRAAEAKVVPLRVDLERMTVKSPVEGKVLRVNVRKGEFVAAAGVSSVPDAAVVVGDVEKLHVRVDIDENDAPRFAAGMPAVGYVRGRTDVGVPLRFVRVEPYVIPKRNLTGASTERVDTRVLQVVYAVEGRTVPMYVGQQVDVFLGEKSEVRSQKPE